MVVPLGWARLLSTPRQQAAASERSCRVEVPLNLRRHLPNCAGTSLWIEFSVVAVMLRQRLNSDPRTPLFTVFNRSSVGLLHDPRSFEGSGVMRLFKSGVFRRAEAPVRRPARLYGKVTDTSFSSGAAGAAIGSNRSLGSLLQVKSPRVVFMPVRDRCGGWRRGTRGERWGG